MTNAAAGSLPGLASSFASCIGELGMWSTARLFVNTARQGSVGNDLEHLHQDLAGDFPVLENVLRRSRAAGSPIPIPDLAPMIDSCRGLRRLLVVGIEAAILAPLIERLPQETAISLLLDGTFPMHRARLQESWRRQLDFVDLQSFASVAGSRSGLLTWTYGHDDFRAVVVPTWVRIQGADVRGIFRRMIGVNLIGQRMSDFPRWLEETALTDFTDLVECA